jgi:hypothetical protein
LAKIKLKDNFPRPPIKSSIITTTVLFSCEM